jgi:hypothetical protein
MYNYPTNTNFNASKGIGEMFGYINSATNDWFAKMTLLAIWFIVVVTIYKAKDDIKGALAVGSFATFIISILFWVSDMCSGWEVSITLGMTLITGLLLLMDN